MGVEKKVLKEGNGTDKPQKGDEVTIEYTGNLYDEAKADNDYRGDQFDSSIGRGDFRTQIGTGKVIRGWDEGVITMTLGEKSVLTISSDYAYGDRGFPGLIPKNSALVFVVELKAINDKKA
ncbi:hypothetical protein G7Y79_00008g024900 [Physcia stellaris]|nr:hypothetical protein G7Y79_00008g024900 [Physcia stellaris]